MYGFFLHFYLKLLQHKIDLKLTSIIFWEKFCCEVFRPRRAQNEVFQVFRKISSWSVSVFCIELKQHEVLKLTQMIFGKTFQWDFRQIGPKNGLKMRFFKLDENSTCEVFWIFAWSYISKNLSSYCFEQNLFSRFSSRTVPEWTQNELCYVLWKMDPQNFSGCFVLSCKLTSITFLGEFLIWGFSGQKRPKKALKLHFSS